MPSDLIDDLDEMWAGVLRWVQRNMDFLSLTSPAELPEIPKMKATLELAQFCIIWGRLRPGDDVLNDVTAFVREIWESPDFARHVAADPTSARQYGLIYGALAPTGVTSDFHRGMLAKLAADGYLAPRRKSPYLHIETRYFADLAGVDHRLDSYADLYAASLLAKLETALPITKHDAYTVTHTVFYLTHFGSRDAGLARDERDRAHRIVCQLTEHYVQSDEWELAAELTLAQFCLGGDPVHTPSGAASIRQLRRVQLPDGAIPGRSVALQSPKSATPIEFFRKAYHPTLVAGLVSLILSSAAQNA